MGAGNLNDTALINAALYGHEECLKTAIKLGADVNCADDKSETALMTSAQLGHDQCVHMFINEGADVNKKTSNFVGDGSTALIFVAGEGHGNCVNLLLKAGADMNIVAGNSYTYTALSKAAENGHSACVKVLLSEATQSCPTVMWKNIALGKSVEKDHTACVDLLLKSGADVNVFTEIWSGYTPLMKAPEAGKFNCVELLLKSGADVNRIDTRGSSALIKASTSSTESSASSDESCICALIKAGADVNVRNEAGETALLHCAKNSTPVDELIQAGADVNTPTKNKGSTPLLEAVQVHKKGLTERIMNSLIQAGADVNCLKQICRKMIRTHLPEVNADGNIFVLVPRLGLPSILASHLLHYVSLDGVKGKKQWIENAGNEKEGVKEQNEKGNEEMAKEFKPTEAEASREHDRTFRNRVAMNLKL